MGVIYTCDCGKKKMVESKDELCPLGIMGLMYCKGECANKMQEFLDDRDKLHDKIMKQWQKELEKLQKKYHDAGCGCLPDEIELPEKTEDTGGGNRQKT